MVRVGTMWQGGGTSVGAAKGAAYNTGWAGANLPDLKKVGYQVVRAAELRTAGECSTYLLMAGLHIEALMYLLNNL